MSKLQTFIGRGTITVNAAIWSDLGSPKTNEAWRTALLLPVEYQIESFKRVIDAYENERFELSVLSEEIPVDGVSMSLCHRKHEDGTVSLVSITMNKRDGERWQKVAVRDFEKGCQ